MKILKQSVGIDVSKSDFKVCLGKLDEQLSVAFSFQKAYDNNLKGVTVFLKEVSRSIYCTGSSPIYPGSQWCISRAVST